MIIGIAVLFVVVGVAMIAARDYLARVQALFAGGTIVPGCIIAEAVMFFLLAIGVIVASRTGLLQ
jgi:hypothetical protein